MRNYGADWLSRRGLPSQRPSILADVGPLPNSRHLLATTLFDCLRFEIR